MRVLSVPAAATTPVPVKRGEEGSAQVTHPSGAQVAFGLTAINLGTADWAQPVAGQLAIASPSKVTTVKSYSAAGAIDLPGPGQDAIAEINGTSALAMTVAAPNATIHGSKLTVLANGKAAHTITVATGLGAVGATADVITFAAGQQQAVELIASGVAWVMAGTNTAVAGAGATINGAGLG
jgi:hypothetical protein